MKTKWFFCKDIKYKLLIYIKMSWSGIKKKYLEGLNYNG